MLAVFLSTLLILNGAFAERKIKIGALFDSDDELNEQLFNITINVYNNRTDFSDNDIVLLVEKISEDDDFEASTAVCNMLQNGAIAIFGPSDDSSQHIQSICDTMNIPNILVNSDPDEDVGNTTINLYPHHSVLGQVLVDLVNFYDWKTFTIFYEDNECLPKLNELIKLNDGEDYIISMRQLDMGNGNDYRELFREVKLSGETEFIIDCSTEILYDVLIQAQQIGLMFDDHSYIITDFDFHTINFEPFKYGRTKFTGMRLVDPKDPFVVELIEFLNEMDDDDEDENKLSPETIKVETALMLDAINMFLTTLDDLDFGINDTEEESFSCADENPWEDGISMVTYMKSVNMKGLTGNIDFNEQQDGIRTDFQLQFIELNSDGIQEIGTWNVTDGVNIIDIESSTETISTVGKSLSDMDFTVITLINPPYAMMKESNLNLTGNDRFEGYGIDLIEEMSEILGFSYTFVVEPTGFYGRVDRETGEWMTGMLKQLSDGSVDLAVADLTITAERQRSFDFTYPFMNLGISILYRAPIIEPPSLFSFMTPFTNEVWMYIGVAFLSVSILLFVVARIVPNEWQKPNLCMKKSNTLSNQFSVSNCFWFTTSSVLQQGYEIAPKAIATRLIAGVWWFFGLIIVATYIANLTFLRLALVETYLVPINDAEDLVDNHLGITYGAVRGGATHSFFANSNDPLYKKMGEYMTNNPEVMSNTLAEGFSRVQSENYAFFMESSTIEYITERQCDLVKIGGQLNSRDYGIAMRKNMPYRNMLSQAVLKLKETGVLQELKDKWWKEKRNSDECVEIEMYDEDFSKLTMIDICGVFLVLLFGCIIAIFIGIGELLINVKLHSVEHKVSFSKELADEMKFLTNCNMNKKPVHHPNANNSKGPEIEDDKNKSTKPIDPFKMQQTTV